MVSVKPGAERRVVRRAPDASGALRARTTVPALSPSTVRRASVEALLDASTTRRLTLVSAGPGWGKTTTVAAWARSRPPGHVAWLTLEPFDDTAPAFWSDVLAALRASGAVPPGHPLESLEVASRLPANLLRRVLRGIELLPAPVVLVLDEFHLMSDPDALGTVDDLLRYPLPLRLVVLTRVDPLLGLQRLRGQGEVGEVGASELAFDGAAVASLAAHNGRALPSAEVEHVLAETDGWAVGVRLRVESPPDAASRARAERSAAEFLLAEVLERQEPVARQFLLRTSVAATVCVDLASALDPGAPAERLLPGLAALHGFVTEVGEQRAWYRYHPLLREMLQSELRVEDPAVARDTHRAAARWFASHDEPLRALEHAVASRDGALVGEVFVEGAAAHLAGPHRETVAETLRRAPLDDLTGVEQHLCAGSLALVGERFEAARRHVAEARVLLADRGDPAAGDVYVELLEASTARALGDVRRLATAASAALATADAVPFPFPAIDAYRELARAHRAAGLAWCDVAVDDARPERRDPPVVDRAPDDAAAHTGAGAHRIVDLGAQAALALQDVAAGRLADGAALARSTLATACARGWDTHVQARAAHAALVWVQLQRAEDDTVDRALAHALAADAGGREPASDAAVRLLQALAAAVRGHARSAHQALAAADRALGPVPAPPLLADLWRRAETEARLLGAEHAPAGAAPVAVLPSRVEREELGSRAVTAVCRARLLLADGRTGAALRALEDVGDEPGTVTRVEAALVEAAALARAGTRRVAVPLARALDLAAPEHLARLFLSAATPELLPALASAVAARDDALAAALRAHLDRTSGAVAPAPLAEPLTERELAVLGALPSMESNVEIAEDFFVSVNTVKAHLKSLYRKLGVGTRRDAVRRGRELGLLP